MATPETIAAPPPATATRPFYFNTSAHLLRIGRGQAASLGELLRGLQTCEEGSIFQHTFRTLQEHHFVREGFSNDFAHWVLAACDEPGLAERMAGVDVREFSALQGVRERFVQILEDYLRAHAAARDRSAREPFYFCASDIVVLPTPFVARTLPEFLTGLAHVSIHSIHHHFIEARLRVHLLSNDFSLWLEEGLALSKTARRLNEIDIYTSTLEGVRRQIIRIVENAEEVNGIPQ
jgi:hypothetical protein